MKRLKEPSTWAGLGVFAQVLASIFPQYALALNVVSGCAAAAAGALPEGQANASDFR
jgi:hypothetical protein